MIEIKTFNFGVNMKLNLLHSNPNELFRGVSLKSLVVNEKASLMM